MSRKAAAEAKGSFSAFGTREALFASFFAGGFLMATWITRTPAIREGSDSRLRKWVSFFSDFRSVPSRPSSLRRF